MNNENIETENGKLREVTKSFAPEPCTMCQYEKTEFVKDDVLEIRSRITPGSPYLLVKCDFFQKNPEYYVVHEHNLMENTELYDKRVVLEDSLKWEDTEEVLFILSKFGKDYKKEYSGSEILFHFLMNPENTILHQLTKEEWNNAYANVAELLFDFFDENQNNEMIKFLLKEDDKQNTSLFYACQRNNVDFMELFMEKFEEKEDLQKALMKENKAGSSCLSEILRNYDPIFTHIVLKQFDNQKGVELLMNYKSISGETLLLKSMRKSSIWFSKQNIQFFLELLEKNVEKEKLHNYLMESDQDGKTVLHQAVHESTLQFILNMFDGKEDYKTLIDFIMKKENRHGRTFLFEFGFIGDDEGNFDKKFDILFSKLKETNQEEKIIQFMDMKDKHGGSALGNKPRTNSKLLKLRKIYNRICNTIFTLSQLDKKMGNNMESLLKNIFTYQTE